MRHHPSVRKPPQADGGITRLAVARLGKAGIDPAPLLRIARLSPQQVAIPHARLDVMGQVAFLRAASEALGDELLGFHLAETFELREARLLYYVLASSPTFGDALARAERYSSIVNEGIVLRCCRGEEISVEYAYVGVPRHADRHQIEFWSTALVRMARQLTGTSLRPTRAAFAHPRCGSSHRIAAFFGCDVAFETERDAVGFASGAADLPLTGADPYLNDLLTGYCDEALAHRSRPAEALRTRVENAITPLLPHGKARVGDVARALGLSQRTLARRLAAEGVTFARILDELRADLARRDLKDPNLSISEIAWLLGFREVSAFTHACRRWTGLTPSQIRSQEQSLRTASGRA